MRDDYKGSIKDGAVTTFFASGIKGNEVRRDLRGRPLPRGFWFKRDGWLKGPYRTFD